MQKDPVHQYTVSGMSHRIIVSNRRPRRQRRRHVPLYWLSPEDVVRNWAWSVLLCVQHSVIENTCGLTCSLIQKVLLFSQDKGLWSRKYFVMRELICMVIF